MVEMGAEVGQKMRSAIKAKLTELDCYVDDELPDYIMVMVANKRTRSQMNEDLNLFLNTKTSTFVDWLHIVLKKLKEVTVTNLEVYKKASKRKSIEFPNTKLKKVKKIKKEKTSKTEGEIPIKQEEKDTPIIKSLTDDLPLNVKSLSSSLSENRNIMILSSTSIEKQVQDVHIPSISEVDQFNLTQLEEIEEQIKSVKSRLGYKIDDEVEEAELRKIVENSRKKPNREADTIVASYQEQEIFSNGRHIELDTSKTIQVSPKTFSIESKTSESPKAEKDVDSVQNTRKEHSRITFSKSDFESPTKSPPRKKSVLDRLGKYGEDKEKPVLGGFPKYSEERGRKNPSERDRDIKDRPWKRSTSEDRKDLHRNENRKNDSKKADRNFFHRTDEDSNERKREDYRTLSSEKRENDRQSGKDSSRLRSRHDLRKNLSKSGFSDSLRKDLKKRLGLSSKVTVPQLDPQLLEDTFKKREVVSVVKVKPRVLPPNAQQANKNLLLKAVADAQKSLAQSKPVGNNFKNDSYSSKYEKPNVQNSCDALYTKHYKSNREEMKVKRISLKEKEKLRQFLSSQKSSDKESSEEKEEEQEYIPKPVQRSLSNVEYVPSSVSEESKNTTDRKHQFIVTLDGIQKSDIVGKVSVKERLHGRRTPSPIVFEKSKTTNTSSAPNISTRIDKSKIPDELPIVPVATVKIKERCKYFPLCRNGEKCDFYHPSRNCEQFPYCKFGEKCLYVHPSCKFGTSCTRRDCPYSHAAGSKQIASRSSASILPVKLQPQTLQTCKFFPNCTNVNCSFYHPKPCKFGKYCKNQAVCNYTHSSVPGKISLTWRSN